MSITLSDYGKELYKVDNKPQVSNTASIEMLFLNRAYKTKADNNLVPTEEQKFQAASLAVMQSALSFRLFSKMPIQKEVSGLYIDISGPVYEDPMTNDSPEFIIDETKLNERFGKIQLNWNENFTGTTSTIPSFNTLYFRKVMASVCCTDDRNQILNLLISDIHKFVIKVFYGSIESNQTFLRTLDLCRNFWSHVKNAPCLFSLLGAISTRAILTGYLRKGREQVKLEPCDNIIVTADRNYFCLGSKKVIFVNCALILGKIKPNDYIHIDDIILRVKRQVKLSIECIVVEGGLLRPRRKVIFPCEKTLYQVTVEELQDLTFCAESNIHNLILPMPGCNAYYKSIRSAMQTLQCHKSHILVTVYQSMVCSKEYAKWIAQTYDGIIIGIDENPKSHQVVRFTEQTRFLIKQCYDLKKPIIISSFLPKECHDIEIVTVAPEDEKHFFFYPDAILLQSNEISNISREIIHGILDDIRARITDFAMEDLSGPFEDKSVTGSDSVARAIVHTAYNINADAIIVTTVSGRMAEKISHFRPKCSIIALTKNIFVVRYLKIFHNIKVAYYKEERGELSSFQERQRLNVKKLFFGILYGLSRRILYTGATIIYACKNPPNLGFPTTIVILKLDSHVIENIVQTLP